MKKIFVAMAATALVLGGCTKGEDVNPSNNEMATVRFAAAGNAGIELMTRAGETQAYTGVIGINYDGAAWEVAPSTDVLAFTGNLSSTSNSLTVTGSAVTDGAVQIKSTGTNEAKFCSFGVAEGTVAINGTTATLAANGNGSELTNDYIYASAAQPVNGNATVAFAYTHVMSKLRVEVYEKSYDNAKLNDGVTIDGFDGLGIVRNGKLNLLDGTITPDATVLPASIAINTEYFVLPQTAGTDKSFTVTYQGKEYTVALGNAGLTFAANKCRVIRLLVTGSGITFTATLEDWTEENSDFNLQ